MNSPERIAYADCFSGISGDMFLGALLHCGMPEDFFRAEIDKLGLDGFNISISPANSHGIGCCKIEIQNNLQQQFRHLSSITKIIEESSLDPLIIDKSLLIFKEIARAEAKVHQIDIEKVHFHEVGALDTIIDVVGVVAGLHYLGITNLYCSPLPSPRGFVICDHGKLPLPAPAVCEILRGIPCYGVDIDKELVTPTGAALIKVLAKDFGPMPPLRIQANGYGIGSHILPDNQPNLFRIITGLPENTAEEQQVEVITTNLDDWNPEGFPYLCELLFVKGALDVSLTSILMKKGRPGFTLKVISPLTLSLDLRQLILSETTAIGLRFRKENRQTLPRRIIDVSTPWGNIKAKKIIIGNDQVIYPEYEDCRRVAKQHKVPLHFVYDAVKSKAEYP